MRQNEAHALADVQRPSIAEFVDLHTMAEVARKLFSVSRRPLDGHDCAASEGCQGRPYFH